LKTKESAGLINWSWLGLACLSLFVYGLADNSRGPVFPDLLKEFALSDSLGAWFFLLCSAGAVLNNVFMLRQMESWGAYRTLQIYTVVQALALLILGLSVRYELILAASVILGLSAGGLCVAQNALTAAAVTHHQRRQAFSALHCMYGFSSLMAPLLVMLFYRKRLITSR
jgi:FHS family glucose/mannose:H+ symporter-like MFS transporter